MIHGDPKADKLQLTRKRVLAKNVRVGDYWELEDGTALRVNTVDIEGQDVTLTMGKRLGEGWRTWARASERVYVRRPPAEKP
jgi:hypothetical protein